MRKSFRRFSLASLAVLCLGAAMSVHAYDVRTRALSPVRFQKTPRHSRLPLIKDGKLNFAIAFDHRLETRGWFDHQSIRPAVQLLQEALKRCTGQQAPTVDTCDKAAMAKHPYLILLGDSEPVRELGIQFKELPHQGFAIKTFKRGIAIVGYDSSLIKNSLHYPLRGTLWGAYDFVERFLGCRFYFPGELGSLWPKTQQLVIDPVSYTDAPRFITRHPCFMIWTMMGKENKAFWEPMLGAYKKGSNYPDSVPFHERWRMVNPCDFWAGHNPLPEKFAKTFPDKLDTIFYTAPNGTRYFQPNQHSGNYLNVLDFGFADLMVESLKRYYASNGKQNDGWFYVSKEFIPFGQCDNEVPLPDIINHPTVVKEKLITEENIKRGDCYSDIYGRFYQYLGNKIKKAFPDKKLVLLPYSNYTRAPLNPRWVLPDNVELRVCVYGMDKIRDSKVAAKWKQIMDEWYRALGNRPIASIWLYNVPGNQFARAIAPMMVKDVIKLFGKTLGNVDIFHDQYGNLEWWHYCANYVHVKTTWNEDFDGMAAIDEHWIPMYGPKAGPVLKEFFQLLYDSYMKYYVPSNERNVLYPPAVIDRLEALLAKAGKLLPPDSVEMKRYRIFSYPWAKAFDTQRNLSSYERPIHPICQLADGQSPSIDGKPDAFWSKVRPLPMVDPKGSNDKPKTPITLRLAWNKEGIYGFAKLGYKSVNDGKQPVWNSDGMELFLCPTLQERNLFHISVDSLGRQYFGTQEFVPVDKPYTSWKCQGFTSAVSKAGDTGWNLEFFLPFSAMKRPAPKAYDCWKMNMVWNRRSDFHETFGSAMTQGNHHNRKMYGVIKFLGKGE